MFLFHNMSMDELKSVEAIKRKLRGYERKHIRFNEPHFTQQLLARDGDRDEVIGNLLNPQKLKHFYSEKGKYGDIKYSLYFEISNTKTMKLPVIFDLNNRKCLYIITYIMRYRPWQNMVKVKVKQ
jgi:hypothetical protein